MLDDDRSPVWAAGQLHDGDHRRADVVQEGYALLVVVVAVLSLIALLIVLARLEPRKEARGVALGRSVSTAPEHSRFAPSTVSDGPHPGP
jgi:hypothetical protein